MIQNNNKVMQEVFWGLEENWWKQIYDGNCHKYGPEVFDKGLGHRNTEPGFYRSIKNACEFASGCLNTTLTIETYKKIHSIACSHFSEVNPTCINVTLDNIYKFRNIPVNTFKDILENEYALSDDAEYRKNAKSLFLLNYVRNCLLDKYNMDEALTTKEGFAVLSSENRLKLIDEYKDLLPWESYGIDLVKTLENSIPLLEETINSMAKIEEELLKLQTLLNLSKPLITLNLVYGQTPKINLVYNYKDPIEIENITNKLINLYNNKMKKLPNLLQRNNEENDLALRYIAELFQNLEWLHPFHDGQGRTDLVLLAKLLTENGFNPSILYFPYFSSFEPLDKWVNYLKEGIEAWKTESLHIKLVKKKEID